MGIVKLDDVLKYEQPTKYIVNNDNYSNDYKIPVLTAGKSFILGYTNEMNNIFDNLPAIIFDDFTTAFHYVDFPFKVKSSAMKILNPVKDKADLKYLFYKMQTISIDKDLHKRYWISKYSQIQISLPDLKTQQKITSILDKADNLRQYNKQLIEKYDALMQSLFLDMFGDPMRNEKGWKVKNGNEYCHKISVGVVIRPASYYVDKGVIALRSLNIKPNRIDLKDLVYFSKVNSETTLAKSQLKTDDVVIIRTGSTGTATIIPKELNNCNCIDLIITRPNKSIINPLYLVYFFNSERGKNIVSGHEVGGIQKHFNIGSIKSLKIPIPPINFQNKFAERVQLIETQKKKAEEALEKSEALFQSLLQKSFKGELN